MKTINMQEFSSNFTYTPSAGMLYCIVEIVGGGGGGSAASGIYPAACRGGAGGSALTKTDGNP